MPNNVVRLDRAVRRKNECLAMQIEAMNRAQADVDDAIDAVSNRLEGDADLEGYYITLMLILKSKLEKLHLDAILGERRNA